MDADAHAHLACLGPFLRGQDPLALEGRGDRIHWTSREGDKKRIALALDHGALMFSLPFDVNIAGSSLAGSLVGSTLLMYTSNATFSSLVPWLLLTAAAVFTAAPWIRKAASGLAGHQSLVVLVAGQFVIAGYGGYFGAGMGVLMMALYLAVWVWLLAGHVGKGGWLRRSAWKNALRRANWRAMRAGCHGCAKRSCATTRLSRT